MDFILNLDKEIMLTIHNLMQNHILIQKVFAFITTFGNGGAIWIVTGIWLLLVPKTRKCGIVVLSSLVLGFIIGNIGLKNIIARPRPFDALDFAPFIITPPTDYSFPSGHTLSSFTASFSIFFFYKKWGIISIILALLITISRVVLTVHYPSDVLVGALIGIAIAFLVKFIFDKLSDKRI